MIELFNKDDLNSPELSIFSSLSENQLARINEPNEGMFIAESSKVIERALEAGYEPVSLLIEKSQLDYEAERAVKLCKDIPVYMASSDVFCNITGYKLTRGALCAMKRKKLRSISEVIGNAPRIAILEDVVNPTNLGAVFRSAAALGVCGIILTKGCTDPLYRRAIRVSMGSVFQIPWTYFLEDNWLEAVKKNGYSVASMALKNDTVSVDSEVFYDIDRLAIVLGNEGNGLRDETINGSDYTIKIPMAAGVDSLNVAAAAGIAFFELAWKYQKDKLDF